MTFTLHSDEEDPEMSGLATFLRKHLGDLVDLDSRRRRLTEQRDPTVVSVGSIAAIELTDETFNYFYDHLFGFLLMAQEHLDAVRLLVFEAHIVPSYAVTTLLRTSLEASVHAQWLLDSEEAAERRSRGIAVALDDFEERLRFEELLQTPTSGGRLGIGDVFRVARLCEHTRRDKAGKEVLAHSVPATLDLFRRYVPTAGKSRSGWLWRVMGGVSHGKVWAIQRWATEIGEPAPDPRPTDRVIVRTAVPHRILAEFVGQSVAGLRKAIEATEALFSAH